MTTAVTRSPSPSLPSARADGSAWACIRACLIKIPVVEKDFVFAEISEELGGIFALCVLLICLGCFLQFVLLAARMQALFYKLIAFGLAMVYAVQVFLTVGGVTKFIPSTGVTLPLVSYGGSSVLSTFIIFGVIQGLYILKQNDEEDYEKDID